MSGTVTPLNSLDTSIPLKAGVGVTAPQNPLTTFGQFAGIQNALTQNRALEAGIKQTEQGTSGMAQQQALQRMGAAQQLAGSLILEHPDGIPAEALASTVARGLGMGIFKRDEVGAMLQDVPMGNDPESTAKRTAWAKQFNVQALGILEQVARSRGVPTTMSDGQTVQPGLMGEQGFQPTGAGVAQFPTRSELIGRTQVGTVPEGQPNAGAPITGPVANVTPPSLGGPAVGGASPLGTGRIPPTLRNPAAAGTGPAAPTAPAGGVPAPAGSAVTGNVVTGLGPAATAAAGATGTGSAAAFQEIANLASGAPDRRAGLQNMLADTGQFVTGPGQDKIKTGQAILQRLSPSVAAFFGITPESIAANESFDKIAARIASQQGAGSDARLGVAQAANPSSKLTPAGVDLILKQLIGNEDYIQARAKLAAAYPNQTDRAGFEAKVGANLDPRVFQFSRMSGEQRRTFFDSLKDKAAFKKAYGWAESNGLLGTP